MSSLKNNFGRLLTDVITDVKDTIDCTILAVEHVLAMNRYRAAEYEKKCKGQKATPAVALPVDIHKVSREIAEEKEVFTNEVKTKIDDSLAEINDDLCDTLGHKSHPSLRNIKEILKSNTNRLSEINQILKQELEKISDDIKKKFARKSPLTEPSIDSVYNDLLILQEAGQNNENDPKERQIDKVFDKILYILDVNNDSNNVTIAGVANELKEEKEILNEEGSLSESIDNEIKILENMSTEIVTEQTTTEVMTNVVPTTAEEPTTTPAPTTTEEPTTTPAPTTAKVPTTTPMTVTTTTHKPVSTTLPPEFYSVFNVANKDSKAHKEAVQQAKNIFEQHKYSKVVMSKIFNNPNIKTRSVFDGLF